MRVTNVDRYAHDYYGRSRFYAITPELQTAPPREGEDHARITERWSVTGVWSYYCTNNEWEQTEGARGLKASRTGSVKQGESPRTLLGRG